MANNTRKNARTVTVTFNGESDMWTAVVTVPRPARGEDATTRHHINICDLGSWLSAYAACLSATSEAGS